MKGFGVQRLVVINSGGYIFADVSMDGPIHLVAPNNRGKSTLVNALQFLYVDTLRKMRFPRSVEETREHYFGSTHSYLLFECVTALGLQTLLVMGRGRLAGSAFVRYVFEGAYRQEDFRGSDDRVADFETVKARLADRALTEIKNAELWDVLCNAPRRGRQQQNGRRLPQLGLLPIRSREDYNSFREAYVRLLSLSNMNAAELRQLLIDCHASEVGEMKLDVAADYKDEFERAERTEDRLDFLGAAGPLIDDGTRSRERVEAYRSRIDAELSEAFVDTRTLLATFRESESALQRALSELEKREERLNSKRDIQNTRKGRVEGSLEGAQRDLAEIDELHAKWSACTPDMLQTMRDNADEARDRIATKKDMLRQAATLNLQAMQRSVRDLKTEVDGHERSLANWEKQVSAWLLDYGMEPDRILKAFRVLNPALLRLVIGDDVQVSSPERVIDRLESIAQCIDKDVFDDSCVRVQLSNVAGPDPAALNDPASAKESLQLLRSRLKEELDRLHIAEDTERARKALRVMEAEYVEQIKRLSEYDIYLRRWSQRPQREVNAVTLSAELGAIEKELEALRSDSLDIQDKRRQYNLEAKAIRESHDRLIAARRKLESSLISIGILPPVLDSAAAVESAAEPEDLSARATRCLESLDRLAALTGEIKSEQDKITSLQRRITDLARDHKQGAYFGSDAEKDWKELIEALAALPELHRVNQQNWNALFTTIRAKLDSLMRGYHAISSAATRVNSAMKRHRVSNLSEVQLSVARQHEACDLLDSLTSPDGLFADREALDRARDRLRRWIKDGKVIRLQDLFAIHIRVQGMDQKWSEAKSLDDIGSTGTGMTAKAMIFIQLVRAVVGDERYRLHFYLDETGQLDDRNLHATTAMAMERGVVPITAEPRVRVEPLAHPVVTVYSLGQDSQGQFNIDAKRTLRARQRTASEEAADRVTD